MEPFELPVGQVLLRPWRADDADATWAALRDPEILLWNSSGSASREAVARFLRARADWSDDEVALTRALGLAALAGVLMVKT